MEDLFERGEDETARLRREVAALREKYDALNEVLQSAQAANRAVTAERDNLKDLLDRLHKVVVLP